MWLLTWLLKTTIDIVTLPLSMAWDLYDWVCEKNQFKKWKTEEKFDKIFWEDFDETFDWDLI